MRVEVTTTLECAPERAWQEALNSRLLQHITWPWVVFEPVDPAGFPAVWSEGAYAVLLRLGGMIPAGEHHIVLSMAEGHAPEQGIYRIRDNGHGEIITRWDHLISLQASADGQTAYTDTVDIEAGLLTPLMGLYAFGFYQYRQWRWRELVRADFRY